VSKVCWFPISTVVAEMGEIKSPVTERMLNVGFPLRNPRGVLDTLSHETNQAFWIDTVSRYVHKVLRCGETLYSTVGRCKV